MICVISIVLFGKHRALVQLHNDQTSSSLYCRSSMHPVVGVVLTSVVEVVVLVMVVVVELCLGVVDGVVVAVDCVEGGV